MNCWACKTKMICGESRPLYEGRQRFRRYDCPKCGEHTYTMEKIISVYEYLEIKDYWKKSKRKKEPNNGTEEEKTSGSA